MNNYELHMKTHTCHDECQNPVCVAVREAVAAEREANKDRIETLYQMYKMASQQRDELMQQQVKALRARLAQPEEPDWSAAGFSKPPTHSEAWWKHEVSNAWAQGYEKGRLQREWIGLTDEEMRQAAQAMDAEPLAEGWQELNRFACAIEAKLKDKNGTI